MKIIGRKQNIILLMAHPVLILFANILLLCYNILIASHLI